jgi:hypothetical protein
MVLVGSARCPPMDDAGQGASRLGTASDPGDHPVQGGERMPDLPGREPAKERIAASGRHLGHQDIGLHRRIRLVEGGGGSHGFSRDRHGISLMVWLTVPTPTPI